MGRAKNTDAQPASKAAAKNLKMVPLEKVQQDMMALSQKYTGRIQQLSMQMNYLQQQLNDKTVNHWLQCLNHAEMFSPEFIEHIVKNLEEYLTVKPEPEQAAGNQEQKPAEIKE